MPDRRNITLLVAGSGASLLGDGMFVVGIGFAVMAVGGGAGALGLVLLAGVATIFACILPAGVLVDRVSRQRVLVAADLVRGALQLLAAVIVATPGAEWWWLLPGSVLFGAATALHQPATMSYIAEVAPPDRLEQVNGSIQALRGLGIVLGGTVAGLIVAASGPVPVMVADAASFLLCAACIAAIRTTGETASVPERAAGATGRDELRAAIALVRGQRWLVHGLLLIAAFVVVSYAPLQVIGPSAATEAAPAIGMSASVLWAWISAATAIGMIAGGVTAFVRPPARLMAVVRLLLLLGAGGPAALLAGVHPLATLPGFAALGAAMGLFTSGWEAAKQARIDQRMLARVASLDMFAQLTGMITGVVLAAAVASLVDVDAVLAGIAGGCALLGLVSWSSGPLGEVFTDRARERDRAADAAAAGAYAAP